MVSPTGLSRLSCSFCLLLSFISRGRSGGRPGRWPLLTGQWMGRRGANGMGERPGGVYAGHAPPLRLRGRGEPVSP